jgi:DNA invertase Pin-like site-specific DNA recombinase
MATYGYARCSDPRSTTMSLEVQIEALRAAGCTVIRSERRSGTTLQDRTELKTLLDFLREGDTLCVTRVDRIARSVTDLMIIVRILEQKGVALKATEQPIDTSSAVGRSLLSMLGVFAELETNLRRERQMESIRRIQEIDRTKPKHERTYKGRPPTIQPDEVRRLKDEEKLGASEIATRLGIGRASVYRVLKDALDSAPPS